MIRWYLRNAAFLLATWTLLSAVGGMFGMMRLTTLVLVVGLIQIILAITVFVQGLIRMSKGGDA